jgi:hypothetical protein
MRKEGVVLAAWIQSSGASGVPPCGLGPRRPWRWNLLAPKEDALRTDDIVAVTNIAPVRPSGLDLIIDAGGRLAELREEVWLIRLGPGTGTDTTQLWETWRAAGYAEVRLERGGSPKRKTILRSSLVAVNPLSIRQSMSWAYWRAKEMILEQIDTMGSALSPPAPPPLSVTRRYPTRPQFVDVGVAGIRRIFLQEYWHIAIGTASSKYVEKPLATFVAPRDGFYADPCLVRHRRRTLLFFEVFDIGAGKGHIEYAELLGATVSAPRVALERPYHLSYPFVFEHRGEWWMIPETTTNRTVELYRARAFPDDWVLETVLLHGVRAADATFLETPEGLWLFAAVAGEHRPNCDTLWAFLASSLHGPWTPHPRNPVVADVRHARPAGRLFKQGNNLIRPAQDCSFEYGRRIVMNRIDVLSPREYAETPVAVLEANELDSERCHCYSAIGGTAVVDAARYRPRYFARRLE